eukprot:TRINITY_DN12672_c0_g1_i1.p1 TRINITY_DN12672_c0_g1~~TRINITY_DN12672_c0_g1_i1.p1  ORF type:complete len:417 (-),score=56.52 TRINITY_DN12672_c0_g1_i1:80-1330(-)
MGNWFSKRKAEKAARRRAATEARAAQHHQQSPTTTSSPLAAGDPLSSGTRPTGPRTGGTGGTVSNGRFAAIHRGGCFAVAAVPSDPLVFLSAGEDRTVYTTSWAGPSPGVTRRIADAHTNDVNRMVYVPATEHIVTASRDKTLKSWEAETGTHLHTFSGHDFNVSALAASEDGTLLCSGSRDNTVRLWDLATGQLVTYNRTARNIVMAMRWIPGTSLIAQTGEDLHVRLWDTAGRQVKLVHDFADQEYQPVSLDVSADGRYLATGHNGFVGAGSMVRVWDVRERKMVCELRGHQYTVTNCCFLSGVQRNPTGSKGNGSTGLSSYPLLATASNDGTLRVWDIAQADCVQTSSLAVSGGRMACAAAAQQPSERFDPKRADIFIGFLSGMTAAYAIDEECTAVPVIEFGEPGSIVDPQD